MLISNNLSTKMFKYMTRNVILVYFAIVSLIFTIMVFIPYIGLLLNEAVKLPSPSIVFTDNKIIEIASHYKWKFNGTNGFGDYEKLQRFKESVSEIRKLNAMESSNVFGITKYSNMSTSEFAKRMLLADTYTTYCPSRLITYTLCSWSGLKSYYYYDFLLNILEREHNDDIPKSVDWREKGMISPVRDQKQCNACWAISVVGLMEAMAIQKGKSFSKELSIQELLDCSWYTDKCQGGNIDSVMYYLCRSRQPIVSETQYPTTLHNEDCRVGRNRAGTQLKWYTTERNIDEKVIPRIIAKHGPVMAVVNAHIWQYYTGGIIRRSCKRMDYGFKHVVQIVGYDMTGDIPYYIAKNSWGSDFGEDGYVRLAMNEDVCGITREIAYLDVD